jgi:hypothetical protein
VPFLYQLEQRVPARGGVARHGREPYREKPAELACNETRCGDANKPPFRPERATGRQVKLKQSRPKRTESPSELIDARIEELGDWRGEMLSRMRALIKEADPEIVEEWKWMGTPVWSHDGIVCTGETYKKVVKLTFAKGASLKDPARLFNSSLDGNTRRAIDIREGEEVDASALKALLRQAVALNGAGQSKPSKKSKPPSKSKSKSSGALPRR